MKYDYKVWTERITGSILCSNGNDLDAAIAWQLGKGIPLGEIHVSIQEKPRET